MAARVLLINLSSLPVLGNRPVYPLGLTCLDAALSARGHAVEVVDFVERPGRLEDLAWLGAPRDVIGFAVRDVDPIDVAAFSFIEPFAAFAARVRGVVRESGYRPLYVGGGAGFSLFAEVLAERLKVDVVIRGEGEAALLRLVEEQRRRAPRAGVSVVEEPDAGFAERAVEHPRRLLRGYLRGRHAEIGVETRRRMCVKKCAYCPYAYLQKGTLGDFRDLDRLRETIVQLHGKGVRRIFFTDAVFNADLPFAKRVCRLLQELRLEGLEWSAYFVPSSFDGELAELLVESGNAGVILSPDSFDDRMLVQMGKLFTMQNVRRCKRLCDRAGLKATWVLLFGAPREDREVIVRSARFANEHFEAHEINVHVGIRVLPGTALASTLGLTPSELLDPVFYPVRPGVFDWIMGDFDERFFSGEKLFRYMAMRTSVGAMIRAPRQNPLDPDLGYLLKKRALPASSLPGWAAAGAP